MWMSLVFFSSMLGIHIMWMSLVFSPRCSHRETTEHAIWRGHHENQNSSKCECLHRTLVANANQSASKLADGRKPYDLLILCLSS